MYEVGTVCMKIAGRDAGQLCVVVENHGDGFVTVDGAVRRRRINIRHMEHTGDVVDIKKGASHEDVCKALGIEPRKTKVSKPGPRPRRQRKAREKQAEVHKSSQNTREKLGKESSGNVAKDAEKPPKKSAKEKKSAKAPVSDQSKKKGEKKKSKAPAKKTPKK